MYVNYNHKIFKKDYAFNFNNLLKGFEQSQPLENKDMDYTMREIAFI